MRIAAFVLAVVSAASPTLASDLVWYDGSLGTLPNEQCWEFVQVSGGATPTMVDGAVHLGPTMTGARDYWTRPLTPFEVDYGAAVTIDTTVVTSNFVQFGSIRRCGFAVTLTDANGRWARMGISSMRVVLQTSSSSAGDQVAPFIPGNLPHLYRLEFIGNTVRLSVDGTTLLTDNPGYNGDHPNTVEFGDLTMYAHSETLTSLVLVESVPMCGPGDFNCDGAIGPADLAELLGRWGQADCPNDLDGDGTIGAGDLAILLGAWTH